MNQICNVQISESISPPHNSPSFLYVECIPNLNVNCSVLRDCTTWLSSSENMCKMAIIWTILWDEGHYFNRSVPPKKKKKKKKSEVENVMREGYNPIDRGSDRPMIIVFEV